MQGASVNLSKAGQIEEGIQALRQLNFKIPVPVVAMTPDQAGQVILEEIHRDYTDEQLKIEASTGAMVGLYPKGIDLEAETLKLLKSQIAGFYEPHRMEMILVSGAGETGFWNRVTEFMTQRDLVGEMLLAHELTHALQDQHFAVTDQLEAIKDNDDRQLALKSVAEGDATVAGLACTIGKIDDATVSALVDRLDQLPAQFAAQTSGVPEALTAPLIFQYSAGARFVGEAFHRGGWRAVDGLYRKPPQSSRQIMHPALYFDRPTLPAAIDIRGYQAVLPDWQRVDANTLGGLLLQVILKRNLTPSAPEVGLADRWAGDRIVTLRRGTSLTVLWLVLFSDEQSAQRFATAYAGALDRFLGAGDTASRRGQVERGTHDCRRGDACALPDLAAAVWKATRIDRPAPPPRSPVRATSERAPTLASMITAPASPQPSR